MIMNKTVEGLMLCVMAAAISLAADEKQGSGQEMTLPKGPQAGLFSTNQSAGPSKATPFSSEISADFIKKVMETSARIEECRKQIAERQSYLYKNNPEIKSLRTEMTGMQEKINAILDADKELVEMRISRDMLWTTMPKLPTGRDQQGMMGPGPMGSMGPRKMPVK